jgi:hypothetical protein
MPAVPGAFIPAKRRNNDRGPVVAGKHSLATDPPLSISREPRRDALWEILISELPTTISDPHAFQ